MNISAPVSMLAGKGSGPALLVVGAIIAILIAQQAKTASTAKTSATSPR